ncbi:MAG: sensor histidine kinase [Bacillota bacterium]|nr:sensor histidine kinase [Bacillota bacterium]
MRKLFKLKPQSVRSRLFVSYGLVFICFVSVLLIIIFTMVHNIRKQIDENNLTISNIVNDKIESYIKEIEYISSLFYMSEAGYYIGDALYSNPQSFVYSHAKDKVLMPYKLMSSISRVSGNIDGIIFLDNTGRAYITDRLTLKGEPENIVQTELFADTMLAYGRLRLFTLNYDESLIATTADIVISTDYVCISRKLINTYSSQKIGMLLLLIPVDKFNELFLDVVPDDRGVEILIHNNVQELVYASDNKLITLSAYDRQKHISELADRYTVEEFPILDTKWSCTVLTSIAETYQPLYIILYSSFAYIVFFIIISVLITLGFSKNIRISAKDIMKFSVHVKKGKLDYRLGQNRLSEFNSVFEALNEMAEKLSDTIEKNLVLNIVAQKAEIKALQAQINPHFLYNTLNAINGCARTSRTDSLISMITALSDILRYSLGSAGKKVMLADELKHIENYLLIQNTRFNKIIRYEKEIDPDLLDMPIAPLLLQPIVENAIEHGLSSQADHLIIRITAYRNDAAVYFQVTDNGQGFEPEKLAELQQQLLSDTNILQQTNDSSSGLGLLNVHTRLRIQYGQPYGLDIQSWKNEGTTIILRLPDHRGLPAR